MRRPGSALQRVRSYPLGISCSAAFQKMKKMGKERWCPTPAVVLTEPRCKPDLQDGWIGAFRSALGKPEDAVTHLVCPSTVMQR